MIQEEADLIFTLLADTYLIDNDIVSFLSFETPFQILILTILSAQTTDRTVNSISGELFRRYPDAYSLACATPEEIEPLIRPTGFYHTKAANIVQTSRILVSRFNGEVPDTMSDLTDLPGVGRKTANIVLNHAFGRNVGIAVDTHVRRLAQRIGFTDAASPDAIEQDLMALFDPSDWRFINYLLISHGRKVCTAKKPDCSACIISSHCRFYKNCIND